MPDADVPAVDVPAADGSAAVWLAGDSPDVHVIVIGSGLAGLCAASVLAAELFNTAIENLADHVHPDLHPQIRIVKDCAAAAVLCAVLGAIGVAVALVVDVAGHWR